VVGISFASEDVTLITVDNGDDAITKAQESRPDAILADVVMPGKSGYEVCEAIKADPALQHIPVLLLTGTFESFDEERARLCGAAGHVAKPFEAQALVERVSELFAQAAAAPPPPAPEPIAAASPASTPEQAPASSSSESFDFFDDDLGDLTPAEPAAAAPEPAREEADPIASDGAFAFGDQELEAAQPEPLASSGPEPAPAARLDRTVAILPDEVEDELDAPAAAPTELDASLEPAKPGTTAEDLLSAELAGPAEPAPQPADDFFDFDIGGSSAEAGRDAAPPVRSEDLAEATVLDPKGASGYDVSSSDLGDPVPAGLFGEAPASEDSLAMPVFGEPLETDSQTPIPAVEPEPEMIGEPIAAPEPLWPPEPPAAPEPVVVPEPAVAPEPAVVPEPVATPEPAWPPEPVAVPEPVATPEPAWPPEPAAPAFEVAVGETPGEPAAAWPPSRTTTPGPQQLWSRSRRACGSSFTTRSRRSPGSRSTTSRSRSCAPLSNGSSRSPGR
jgi:CheY-like chemotaxis protein